MVRNFLTRCITNPNAADKVFGQTHEGQVVPVFCGTGFAGNVFIGELCSGTSTVVYNVLQQLVDQGNTVIVIEHNLDVLKSVDYIFDLGPDGGRRGGRIVAQGTPEQLAQNPASVTGPFLKEILANAAVNRP